MLRDLGTRPAERVVLYACVTVRHVDAVAPDFLLEKDIGKRRPQYAGYVRRTSAFFPGMPKRP